MNKINTILIKENTDKAEKYLDKKYSAIGGDLNDLKIPVEKITSGQPGPEIKN